MIFPGTRTFQQWQEQDKDLNSVIADPLFIDPDKGDFRPRKDSPALKLGFKQIEYKEKALELNGIWLDGIVYELRRGDLGVF